MHKKFIIANWKMNGDLNLVKDASSYIMSNKNTHVIICPPSPLLGFFEKTEFDLGAQNITAINNSSGAFTGEISGTILKDAGCEYVIIGHSERRILFQENTTATLFSKITNALNAGLKVIFCIGEALEDFENNKTEEVLRKQLEIITSFKKSITNILIAYEPVWSIGTGKIPKKEDFIKIKNLLENLFDKNVKLVYGGSVNVNNAEEIIKNWPVDGLLIGGASLKISDFQKIIDYCR